MSYSPPILHLTHTLAAVPDGSGDGSAEQLEPPTVDELKEWAAKAFADPKGDRLELPALAAAYQSTNGLLINAKEALRQLFEQRRKEICRSPERPDLQLSQEEALGWLLAYTRGRQLLDEEARPISKVASKQAGVAKQQCDAVRDAAKTKRSKARKRSATLGEQAAIGAEAEARRSAIFLNLFELSRMPAANTTIVERRARPVAADRPSAERRAPERRAPERRAQSARAQSDRAQSAERPSAERRATERPSADRAQSAERPSDRAQTERRAQSDRAQSAERPSAERPTQRRGKPSAV